MQRITVGVGFEAGLVIFAVKADNDNAFVRWRWRWRLA
jgi:hypothetical protein